MTIKFYCAILNLYLEKKMDTHEQDFMLGKLIVLYVLETIEIPLTEQSIVNICYSKNNWIENYMDCKEIIYSLVDTGFIYKTNGNSTEDRFTITYTGRDCLSHFYHRINQQLKEQITEYQNLNKKNELVFIFKTMFYSIICIS